MILAQDRRIAWVLLRGGLFTFYGLMRCQRIRPRWGAGWIFRWLLRRQTRDGLHHAPACPGNEWGGMELALFRLRNSEAANAEPGTNLDRPADGTSLDGDDTMGATRSGADATEQRSIHLGASCARLHPGLAPWKLDHVARRPVQSSRMLAAFVTTRKSMAMQSWQERETGHTFRSQAARHVRRRS